MFAPITSLDHYLFWLINSHHTVLFDHFFSIITWLGSGWVIAPILLFFVFKEVPAARRVSIIMFFLVMMVASGLINSQVKHIFRTLRPAAVFEQKTPADSISRMWRFPAARTVHIVGERLMQDSFPSGHTNTAFSAAMLMVLCFSKRFWPAFFIAGLVGYSRVYMGVHFPIDVFAGALFGIGIIWIGFICCNRFVRRGKIQ